MEFTNLQTNNDSTSFNPVCGLPEDVLYYIFQVLTSNDEDRVSLLLRISHSCRRWRTLALQSPALWTSIHIGQPCPRFLDRHRAWIQRSNMSRLNISMCLPAGVQMEEFNNYIGICLDVLTPHASRWGSLVIKMRYPIELAKSFKPSFPIQMPELMQLSLDIPLQEYFPTHLPANAKLPSTDHAFPRLQDARVLDNLFATSRSPPWSTRFNNKGTIFHPGLRKLVVCHTDWAICDFSIDDCLAVLQTCPLLEEFILHAYIREKSSFTLPITPLLKPGLEERVLAPNLVNLGLCRGRLPLDTLPLIARLRAPLLKTLNNLPIPVHLLPYINSLEESPFPSLEKLTLAVFDKTPGRIAINDSDDTMKFLGNLAHLHYLEIWNASFHVPNSTSGFGEDIEKALRLFVPTLRTVLLVNSSKLDE